MSRWTAVTLAAAAGLACVQAATAQATRNFPQNALRGELTIGNPPEAWLNGAPARLAPGVRIRGTDNLLRMSGQLAGQKMVVNYTVETTGLVKDVWMLRDDERTEPWPRSPEQAAAWRFDPLAQTWTKP